MGFEAAFCLLRGCDKDYCLCARNEQIFEEHVIGPLLVQPTCTCNGAEPSGEIPFSVFLVLVFLCLSDYWSLQKTCFSLLTYPWGNGAGRGSCWHHFTELASYGQKGRQETEVQVLASRNHL